MSDDTKRKPKQQRKKPNVVQHAIIDAKKKRLNDALKQNLARRKASKSNDVAQSENL